MYKKRTFRWIKITATEIHPHAMDVRAKVGTPIWRGVMDPIFSTLHRQIDNQIKSMITHEMQPD